MKVLTFGTFDRLHPGHFDYLKQAYVLGSELFTIVALDTTVLKTKNYLPQFNQNQRLNNLNNLKIPDHNLLLGHPTNPYHFINVIQPDIIALGYDQTHFTEKLQNKFPNIKIVRLKNYKEQLFKSSIIAKFQS